MRRRTMRTRPQPSSTSTPTIERLRVSASPTSCARSRRIAARCSSPAERSDRRRSWHWRPCPPHAPLSTWIGSTLPAITTLLSGSISPASGVPAIFAPHSPWRPDRSSCTTPASCSECLAPECCHRSLSRRKSPRRCGREHRENEPQRTQRHRESLCLSVSVAELSSASSRWLCELSSHDDQRRTRGTRREHVAPASTLQREFKALYGVSSL